MSLALPALVILLTILPGIAAFYGYFAGRFDRRMAGVSGVEEVALYVILSIPIDTAARAAFLYLFRYDLDFGASLLLLAGSDLSDQQMLRLAGLFRQFGTVNAVMYFGVLLFSYAAGAIVRRSVWALRLDTRVSLLELKHPWYYVLQGRRKDMARKVFTYADVLTAHPDEKSRLYRGVVLEFEISKEGKIDSLTLTEVTRGRGRGSEFAWIQIPSERLTVMGSQIHSINLQYVQLELTPEGVWPKFHYYRKTLWRSFCYQEP